MGKGLGVIIEGAGGMYCLDPGGGGGGRNILPPRMGGALNTGLLVGSYPSLGLMIL